MRGKQQKRFWVLMAPQLFVKGLEMAVDSLFEGWQSTSVKIEPLPAKHADDQMPRWRITPRGESLPLTTVQLAQVNGFIDGWIQASLTTARSVGLVNLIIVVE